MQKQMLKILVVQVVVEQLEEIFVGVGILVVGVGKIVVEVVGILVVVDEELVVLEQLLEQLLELELGQHEPLVG